MKFLINYTSTDFLDKITKQIVGVQVSRVWKIRNECKYYLKNT